MHCARSGGLRALVLLALAGSPVDAVDALVPGTKLDVRGAGRRESLRFVAKGRFALPTSRSPDDPTAGGASFTLVNPTTGESYTFNLPNARWTAGPRGASYRYRDPPLSAFLGARALRVAIRRTGITLDEPAQGALAVVLALGSFRYCARFDDGAVVRDRPRRFTARHAVPPARCATAGPTTSSTTTTLAGTSTTSTPPPTTTTTLAACGGTFPTCAGGCPAGFACGGSVILPCACR